MLSAPLYTTRGGNAFIDSPAGPTGLLGHDLNQQTNERTDTYNSVGSNRQMVKQEGVAGVYNGFGMVDKLREHKWYV